MDRREAIEYVKQAFAVWKSEFCTLDGDWSKETEALDLAIEALMLQDKYIKAVERMIEGAKEIKIFLERMTCDYNAIDAESATTTDCISRAGTLKALCAECDINSHCYYPDKEAYCTEYAVVKGMPPVKLKKDHDFLIREGEKVSKEQKSKLDCISRQQAIEALTGWETEPLDEDIIRTLNNLPPVTPTEQNEEDILKFYYVESLDEYWIGQRCGTRYYGKWTGNCFTYGYSRYLPWGEHVVAPDTLWKEHTYPSEPKEIPFNEWLQGFLEKECQTGRTGEWIEHDPKTKGLAKIYECPFCGDEVIGEKTNFCPNCGAKMKGGTENE